MDKEIILQQIQALPEKSRWLIGFNEMAKDLSEVMEDDETVQGVTDACKKSITHFVKNGRMLRSFMAVTNKNEYLLSRGRLWLNAISILDSNIKIPRSEIVFVEQRDIPSMLKVFYAAELVINTKTDKHEIYVGSGFEKYLPSDFLESRTFGTYMPGVVCNICGMENAPDARFCSQCGAEILKQQMKGRLCLNRKYEVGAESRFCPNCGTELRSEKIKKICSICGAELAEESKFCTVCGTPADI